MLSATMDSNPQCLWEDIPPGHVILDPSEYSTAPMFYGTATSDDTTLCLPLSEEIGHPDDETHLRVRPQRLSRHGLDDARRVQAAAQIGETLGSLRSEVRDPRQDITHGNDHSPTAPQGRRFRKPNTR